MKRSGEQGRGDLKRSLYSRHIQLIVLDGAIGTGLFMGSDKSISLAGLWKTFLAR